MRIGILLKGLGGWAGGIKFLELILIGFNSIPKENNIEIYLIGISDSSRKIRSLGSIVKAGKKIPTIKEIKKIFNIITNKEILTQLSSCITDYKYVEINGSKSGLKKAIKKNHIEILLPVMGPLINFEIPWIGYLTDCQHKHYPEFFTEEGIKIRDKNINAMLSNCESIVVNSKDVKKDLEIYYKDKVKGVEINVLPFTPILNKENISKSFESKGLKNYGVQSKEYFIVSNQFWEHKDHETAFYALHKFIHLDSVNKKIKLVCTGSKDGQKTNLNYLRLIEIAKKLDIIDSVIITGHLEREEHLMLMGNSIGIIQPTLFEGGPGGGAVYDAIALGIPCIVSNISINQEIIGENIYFFEPKDRDELSSLMNYIYSKCYGRKSKEFLTTTSELKARELGDWLFKILNNDKINSIHN